MLELVELFLFFKVEMFCHGWVCGQALDCRMCGPGGRAGQRAARLRPAAVAQRLDRHLALGQFVGTENQRIARARWRRPS
jgi:hypothetical protein